MRLAIVGSRELEGSVEAEALIEQVLDRFNPELVVSGGARGIDTMAAAAAHKRGIKVHEFLPKTHKWGGHGGFRERNIKIAEYCDVLVAIRSKNAKTYGSGWTANYAQTKGKEVIRHEIQTPR